MNDFHLNQLNKVLDYIEQNLDSDLKLDKIASIGNYSVFFFHRLFRAYTTKTLNEYVTRKPIEKIASSLTRNKSVKISELSYSFGFSSNSSLNKTFKKIYEISLTKFRQLSSTQYDKIIKSKNGQEFEKFEEYICHINNLKKMDKYESKCYLKRNRTNKNGLCKSHWSSRFRLCIFQNH